MDYSTDRSKAVVPVLVLRFLLSGLFYEAICLRFCLVVVFFSPFRIAITSLGDEKTLRTFFFDLLLFGFVSFFSSSWCLGRAEACDCGTP